MSTLGCYAYDGTIYARTTFSICTRIATGVYYTHSILRHMQMHLRRRPSFVSLLENVGALFDCHSISGCAHTRRAVGAHNNESLPCADARGIWRRRRGVEALCICDTSYTRLPAMRVSILYSDTIQNALDKHLYTPDIWNARCRRRHVSVARCTRCQRKGGWL